MYRRYLISLTCFILLGGAYPHNASLQAQNNRKNKIEAPADTTAAVNEEDPFNLDQVVVTATRTQKRIKDIPVITQVVTSKQIVDRGLSNIQDLLQQEVPGLNFQEVGFGTSISLQGLGSKHILFLVDGERIAGETGGNIDYSRINLSNVDRIEIVKGASSALYGSQAMGGVINIITKEAKKKVEVSAGYKLSQFNQRNEEKFSKDHPQYIFWRNVDKPNMNGNVSVGLNLGSFTMNTDVIYKSADGYQLYDKEAQVKYFPSLDTTITEPVSTTPASMSGYEDVQVTHKMTYKYKDKFKIQANGGYYMLNKYDFSQDGKFDHTSDFTYGAVATYNFTPQSVLTASFHGDAYSRYDRFERREDGQLLDYKNNLIQPRILYSNTAWKNQEFTAGAEFYMESLYGDKFNGTEDQQTGEDHYKTKSHWNSTVFVQDDWKINSRFNMVAGVRGDYHQMYGFNVTPKLSFMYKTRQFTTRFNYARGFRSPSLKELYMDWDHLGMFWIYGNADLKPETNNYLSLSGEYSNSWMNISANGYFNFFRNKIEGMWTNNQQELHYINIGHSLLAGVEVMSKFRICRNVYFYGNYNYLYTSKDEAGVQLSAAAPHSGTVRLEYKTFVPDYQTVVNLSGNITGAKHFDVLGQVEQPDGQIIEAYYKADVPAYSLWNLTVSQNITRMFRLTLGVNNLLGYQPARVTFNTSTSPGRIFFFALNFTL